MPNPTNCFPLLTQFLFSIIVLVLISIFTNGIIILVTLCLELLIVYKKKSTIKIKRSQNLLHFSVAKLLSK